MNLRLWIADWLGVAGLWLANEPDPYGVIADKSVEIVHLQDEVANLRAALVPFAEVGGIMCHCGRCSGATITITARGGATILAHADFKVAKDLLENDVPLSENVSFF